jgi:transcription-repair coupling factor (superfamily II helicase)
LVRAAAARGRSTLALVPGPDRFLNEVRIWLTGTPASYLFAEVRVSLLDHPPAYDEATSARLEALAALASNQPSLVVSSRLAATRMTIGRGHLAESLVELRPGLTADPLAIASALVELGYSREPLAEGRGQFSLRGGILDVFPATASSPIRAEWSGQEIESLRVFDPANQRSIMAVPRVAITPGKELLIGEARGRAAVERLQAEGGVEGLRGDVQADWADDLRRLEIGSSFPGIEFYSAYLDPDLPSLFDHLPADVLVIDLAPERQLSEARETQEEAQMLLAAESENSEIPRGFRPPMVPLARLVAPPGDRLEIRGSEEGEGLDLGFRELEALVGRPQALQELIADRPRSTVIVASEQSERLIATLAGAGVIRHPSQVDLDLDLELEPGFFHAEQDLAAGFENPDLGLTVITDGELFGRIRRPQTRGRGKVRSQPILSLDFQPNDLVVHVDHGVARFLGMKLLEQDGSDREYLELEYAEGDRLFVPVESLDRIQRYLGGGEGVAPLHRMGTADWDRAKTRAKKSAEDVAEELLKLYSAREAKPGIAFPPDTPWQTEMEAAFPYQETPDQLAALAEIKSDMESEQCMDRLVCGDVGFGKTELAVRAAFKAVMGGKQVVVLAPTTVLAQQHFQVFSERMGPYPIQVEMLSRFRSEEEQGQTLIGLKTGTVDLVIGTHRLLQSDVRFKRLGLVVVDEEQRFGVMQKERLKKLRAHVDVLSLSATPIPRSLHMSLVGIRDMSVIQTPPEERQPIKTYVTADEDELVSEVIRRELDRGGQVYYVHNRVRTIQKAADRVAALLPGARIAIGHGQMEEEELARVMVEFGAKEHDILVCTTIIESGLDIPNVNTIVVERADRFGLSQLYQLRGRVGRAGKRAYAYFLYDPTRTLTETADKRLDVISGLHELGQGFKIALRDLEIRGAGNLLGTEQHGAIAAVGFEMYMQMLQSTVSRMRDRGEGQDVSDVLTTADLNLDLPLDHFIPHSFVRDERLRLGAYRDLAASEDEEMLEGTLRSLRDRFGPLPVQVENLAYSLRVKIRGQKLGLRSVNIEAGSITVRVDPERVLDTEHLQSRYGRGLRIGPNRLTLQSTQESWREDLLVLILALAEGYEHVRMSEVSPT